MKHKGGFIFCFILVLSISFAIAEYSIDISGLKGEYSIGEEITYEVLLLEDGSPVTENVSIIFESNIGKDKLELKVKSNEENSLIVEKDFAVLGWSVTASYLNKSVKRSFSIKESSEVEFLIEGDKLIIRNKGNVRYTRDVQITIGDVTESYTQNIPVNEEKSLRLIAPQGSYDIKITDGKNTFSKNNVQLSSPITGNAIGAMNEDLSVTGFLGGPTDPDALEKSLNPVRNYIVVITFIGAVFGLAVLLLIERKLRKK